jgi:hypothetical protein
MLYNTGGVTQTFGSLHNYCVSGKTMIEDEVHATGNDPTRIILDKVDIVSVEPWTKRFGISAVMKMQNLEKRAPETMRKAVAVVDAMKESPEQVVEKVTGCFAGGSQGLPELGLGSAEEDVVLNAWQSHMQFTKNARIFRRWGDIFHYFSLFLTVLSSTVAVLVTTEDMVGRWTKETGFPFMEQFNMVLLVIPIVSSVVAATISKKRLLQKWAGLLAAAGQIVREIYCFRMDVNEYDPRAASSAGGEGGEEEEEADAAAEPIPFNPRDIFVRRYQEINKFALDHVVGDDSMVFHANSYLDLNQQSHKDIFKQRLRKYVPSEVLGGFQKTEGAPEMAGAFGKWAKRCICGKPKHAPEKKHDPTKTGPKKTDHPTTDHTKIDPMVPQEFSDMEAGGETDEAKTIGPIEPDDFVSPCTIETYIEYRSKPLLILCETACQPLAKRLEILEMVVIFAGAAGTFISAVGYGRFVALTVSFVSVVMNVMQHEMLQQRLASTNSAIRELRNMKFQMDSLSIVSKRTQEMKTLCVDTVETAILETTTTWTGISARPTAVAEGGGGES